MIDWDKPLITRDGRNARMLDAEMKGNKQFAVAIENDQGEYVLLYNPDGRTHHQPQKVRTDLSNGPHTYWVNIYNEDFLHGEFHFSRESADECATKRRIACLKFIEGDGIA